MKKRRYSIEDRDYLDEEFEVDTRKIKDKRKERRFERALRTKDISELSHEDGLDPEDIEDEIWDDEIVDNTTQQVWTR
jgi:hypothetical protein